LGTLVEVIIWSLVVILVIVAIASAAPGLLVSYGLVKLETLEKYLVFADPPPTITTVGSSQPIPTVGVVTGAVQSESEPVVIPATAPEVLEPVLVSQEEQSPTPWPVDVAATEQVLAQQTADMQATVDQQGLIDKWLNGPPSTPTPTTVEDWKKSFQDQPDCSRVLVGWIGEQKKVCDATATAEAGH
jgi:hypothetical protein